MLSKLNALVVERVCNVLAKSITNGRFQTAYREREREGETWYLAHSKWWMLSFTFLRPIYASTAIASAIALCLQWQMVIFVIWVEFVFFLFQFEWNKNIVCMVSSFHAVAMQSSWQTKACIAITSYTTNGACDEQSTTNSTMIAKK